MFSVHRIYTIRAVSPRSSFRDARRRRLVFLASSVLIGACTLFGGAGPPTQAASAATPTTVNAGVALRHAGPGGYSVTQDGTVSAFGGAPALAGTGVSMWPGQNIVRGIALRSDDLGGYVLDLYGGIHPFGNAPALGGGPYWGGWDIARGIVLRSDNAGGYMKMRGSGFWTPSL